MLLNSHSGCLYAYNETASQVWELIEAGGSEEEWASEFARTWGIPSERARTDIQAIVAQWRLQGLLAGSESDARIGAIEPSAVESARRNRPRTAQISEWTSTIGGVPIAFAIEGGAASPITQMLRQLETPGAQPQMRLEIRQAESGERLLLCDGAERVRTSDETVLGCALWQIILETIHPDVTWLALMHGAAVARDGHAVALCGPSGSGKSTLAAGLIGGGFDYLADDLVALAAPEGTIMPWPMPLSIKPGSVDIVSAHCKELAQAPRYHTKGLVARLLVPPATVWDAAPVKLRNLVFPRYAAGATPALQRISSFEALERLLTDRVWIGYPITRDRVSAFLAWLQETPAHVSVYGSLRDGMQHVENLLS